jgi:hypothetical protein
MKATTGWAAACVIGLAVLLCARSAPAQAASSAQNVTAGGKTTQLSGTFKVSIALDVSKGLPDGTQVSAAASAQLQGDRVYINDEAGLDATTTVSGGKVSITLDIPYTWNVTSTADTVIVQLSVSASAQRSNVQLQYSSSFTQTIALPKNGAMTPVKFTGSL